MDSRDASLRARRFAFRVAHDAVIGVIVVAIASTIVGFCGAWWWVADLFAHFRAQYVVTLIVGAGAAAALRRFRLAGLAGAVALTDLFTIVPLYLGRPAVPRDATHVRVLEINVQMDNPDHERLARLIAARDPDVVALVEYDDVWRVDLAPALAAYPYRFENARDDWFGSAIYAKRPLTDGRAVYFGGSEAGASVATIDVGGTPVTFVVVHPPPPINAHDAADHARALAGIGDAIGSRSLGARVVVVGDLNTTPWSARFRDLVRRGRLHDTRRGFGLQWTWPVERPLLWIPIDQCLVSDGIVAASRTIEPSIGSDHYPVLLDLAVQQI